MASLYRKWRSRSFDDLIGQEHVVRTLRNAVRQQRIAHAYLFTGPRGTGKTSTARILARAVNCLDPRDGNPCNECETCRAANEGRAMDVVEIDAASNTSVENVRDLRERVAYAAGEGRYKVYIVDEVHRLSGAAFDAFLKTLEEPPPHVIFVFASTEPHKVPETITSRCQRFDFRRIPPHDTLLRLRHVARQEDIAVQDEALQVMALHAEGSLRDALGLLDQVASYTPGEITDADVRDILGLADPALVGRLSERLIDRQVGEGLSEFHRFLDAGGEPRQLTRQFVEYWRALLLRVAGAAQRELSVDPALAEHLGRDAGRLSESQIVAVLRAIVDQDFSSKFNVPAQLPFEVGYVQASLALRPQNARMAEGPPERRQAETQEPAAKPEAVAQIAPPRQPMVREPQPKEITLPPAEPEPKEIVAPPTPVTTASNGQSTLSRVEAMWPAIVSEMRAKSPSVQAFLRSAHVMKAENGEITVGFPFPFHVKHFADPQKRKMVEAVVEQVLGASYRVSFILTSKEEIEAVKGAGALHEDDGFVAEVEERLRRYHADELGNGNS